MNTQKMLEEAVNRLRDVVQGDDGQAYKEANKFLLSYDALKFNESVQTLPAQVKELPTSLTSGDGEVRMAAQVGNFGDSHDDEMHRRLANLPLPDYSQPQQGATK